MKFTMIKCSDDCWSKTVSLNGALAQERINAVAQWRGKYMRTHDRRIRSSFLFILLVPRGLGEGVIGEKYKVGIVLVVDED